MASQLRFTQRPNALEVRFPPARGGAVLILSPGVPVLALEAHLHVPGENRNHVCPFGIPLGQPPTVGDMKGCSLIPITAEELKAISARLYPPPVIHRHPYLSWIGDPPVNLVRRADRGT